MMLLTLGLAATAFTGCSKDEPFYTAGPDDFPRILNTDLPAWQKGVPGTLNEISRDQNFTYEVIVTPKEYTTIKWCIDGVIEHVGNAIDQPLLAGNHLVTIIAETVAGKSSSRTFYELVKPLAEDPVVDAAPKARWFNPDKEINLAGENLDGTTGACLRPAYTLEMVDHEPALEHNDVHLNVTLSGNVLAFTVPAETEEGQYTFIVEKEGERFACGDVTVSNSPYVDPGQVEVILWQGGNALNWDAENIKVTAEQLADVPVGTDLLITYEKIPAEELAEVYWALRIVGPWWGPDILEQTDFGDIEEVPYILPYTAERKAIVDEQGAMSLVGNGLRVSKISYMKEAPAEQTLWTGNNALNWDAENIKVTAEEMAGVEVGKDICIFYEKIPAEELAEVYWALRIVGPWWGPDILEQTDFGDIEENPYVLPYTAERKAVVDEQGAMFLVGNGLKITKITVK